MNTVQTETFDRLVAIAKEARTAGFAVVIYTPDEVKDAAIDKLEEACITRGNDWLDMNTSDDYEPAEDGDPNTITTPSIPSLDALTKYHHAMSLAVDYIENGDEDDPDLTKKFFACREAWRAAFRSFTPATA